MACSSCGKSSKNQLIPQAASFGFGDMVEDSDFSLIEYNGPNANHIAPSPTGIMRSKYGKSGYGLHGKGHQFYVHNLDINARPDLFVLVEVPEEETTEEFTEKVEKQFAESDGELNDDKFIEEKTVSKKPARRKRRKTT